MVPPEEGGVGLPWSQRSSLIPLKLLRGPQNIGRRNENPMLLLSCYLVIFGNTSEFIFKRGLCLVVVLDGKISISVGPKPFVKGGNGDAGTGTMTRAARKEMTEYNE